MPQAKKGLFLLGFSRSLLDDTTPKVSTSLTPFPNVLPELPPLAGLVWLGSLKLREARVWSEAGNGSFLHVATLVPRTYDLTSTGWDFGFPLWQREDPSPKRPFSQSKSWARISPAALCRDDTWKKSATTVCLKPVCNPGGWPLKCPFPPPHLSFYCINRSKLPHQSPHHLQCTSASCCLISPTRKPEKTFLYSRGGKTFLCLRPFGYL